MKRARDGRASREYTCRKFSEGLQSVFGVCVANDDACTHPTSVCRSCYEIITKNRPPIVAFEWQAHEPDNCKVDQWYRRHNKMYNCIAFIFYRFVTTSHLPVKVAGLKKLPVLPP